MPVMIGVDQQDLAAGGSRLEGEIDGGVPAGWSVTSSAPGPKPGARTASQGCSERRLVVEVAPAPGLPLAALAAVAVAALTGPLDLGRGPLQGGADLVGPRSR